MKTPQGNIVVIGITGGIGSGKSAVSEILRSHAFTVLSADEFARRAVDSGSPALSEIFSSFGENVITEHGALDRKKMADIVFKNRSARELLEEIVHPYVVQLFVEEVAKLIRQKQQIVFYEAPLLVETGLHKMCDGVIVVSAPKELCIERAALRDKANQEDISLRINAQVSDNKRREAADWIIENDKDLEHLNSQTEKVLSQILKRYKISLKDK